MRQKIEKNTKYSLKYEKTMIKTVQVYLTYSFKIGKYFETWIY